MAHFDTDKMDSKVYILVRPGTDKEEGRIRAYYSKSGVCYAEVVLFCGNILTGEYFDGIGKAGGYGYDKFSAAVSDALHNGGMAYTASDISDFTFGRGDENTIQAIKVKKIIPVYSGAGNVFEAFGIYWTVLGV